MWAALRFAPKSRHVRCIRSCLLRANSGRTTRTRVSAGSARALLRYYQWYASHVITELSLLLSPDTMLTKSQLAWSRIEPCGWVCTPALHRALISAAARPKLVVRFDAPVRKHVTS
jgi:hypothetical protein